MYLRLIMSVVLAVVFVLCQGIASISAEAYDYARWSKNKMPLKVYIEQTSTVPGFKRTYPVEVAKALRQWKVDTKGLIDFTVVPVAKDADIIVTWANKIKKESYTGQAEGHSYAWGITKLGNPTKITLVTSHPLANNQNLSENNIYMIALHEIGHSLGIWWHTRDPNDIMYPDFIVASTTANGARIILNKNRGTLSDRDIVNLIALYNNNNVKVLDKVAKGTNIQIRSVNNDVIGSVETTGSAAATVATNTKTLNVDLGKALAYLKENPNSPEAYNNIGLVYLENNDAANAITNFNKSLEMNPDYAKGHFNLALAYSKEKNFGMAISHYEKYLKLDPDSAQSDNVKLEIDRLKSITFK